MTVDAQGRQIARNLATKSFISTMVDLQLHFVSACIANATAASRRLQLSESCWIGAPCRARDVFDVIHFRPTARRAVFSARIRHRIAALVPRTRLNIHSGRWWVPRSGRPNTSIDVCDDPRQQPADALASRVIVHGEWASLDQSLPRRIRIVLALVALLAVLGEGADVANCDRSDRAPVCLRAGGHDLDGHLEHALNVHGAISGWQAGGTPDCRRSGSTAGRH